MESRATAAKVVPFSNLRDEARVFYCIRRPDISIAEMARTAPFDRVTKRTLENWASEDQWVEGRRRELVVRESAVQKEERERYHKKRLEQLAELEKVTDKVYRELIFGEGKFKNQEGAIREFVRLMEFQDRLLDRLERLLPQPEPKPGEHHIKVNLTEEEVRAMVHAVLRVRREKQMAEEAARAAEEKRRAEGKSVPGATEEGLGVRRDGAIADPFGLGV